MICPHSASRVSDQSCLDSAELVENHSLTWSFIHGNLLILCHFLKFWRRKNRPRLKTQRRRLKTQRRRLKTQRRRLKKNWPRPPAKNRRPKTRRRNSANAGKYSAVLVLPKCARTLQGVFFHGAQNIQQFLALLSQRFACGNNECPGST